MICAGQARLAIGIRHRREVATEEFEIGAEFDVVGGHLEHAQMEIGDRGEGTTRDQQKRRLLRVVHLSLEAKFGEHVVVHGCRRNLGRRLVNVVTLPSNHFCRHLIGEEGWRGMRESAGRDVFGSESNSGRGPGLGKWGTGENVVAPWEAKI